MDVESVRSLGHRTDLALLHRGGSTICDRGDHLVVRTDDNPNFWWGNFLLLRSAPTAGETGAWVRRFEEEFPTARHRAFGIGDPGAGPGGVAGFLAAGYAIGLDTVLTASAVTAPTRPHSGADCRPLAGDADWQQHVELQFLVHCDPTTRAEKGPFMAARAATRRRIVDSGQGVWVGAFLEGRLVAQLGLVAAGTRLARFQDVETHPAFRRRGLAATLVHGASAIGFGQLGARTLVMVADPDDEAIRVYRALGFVEAEHRLGVDRA